MSLKIKKAIDPVWKRGANRVPKNFVLVQFVCLTSPFAPVICE
jgi:hypothetical protein